MLLISSEVFVLVWWKMKAEIQGSFSEVFWESQRDEYLKAE
jgi:hypothetical protein